MKHLILDDEIFIQDHAVTYRAKCSDSVVVVKIPNVTIEFRDPETARAIRNMLTNPPSAERASLLVQVDDAVREKVAEVSGIFGHFSLKTHPLVSQVTCDIDTDLKQLHLTSDEHDLLLTLDEDNNMLKAEIDSSVVVTILDSEVINFYNALLSVRVEEVEKQVYDHFTGLGLYILISKFMAIFRGWSA